MAEHDSASSIRLAIVDDHRLLAQMLADHLVDEGFEAVVAHVDDDDLASTVRRIAPDVVLLDAVFHDDEDGGLRLLRALADDDFAVAMLTGVDDEIRHAEFLDEGAFAVISKSDSFEGVLGQVTDVVSGLDPHGATRRSELAETLVGHRRRQAATGSAVEGLTNREHATLQSLVDGNSVDDIARRRTVATSTVRSQIRAVLSKLGAHSQVEAVSIAARSGMSPSGL